MQRDDGVGLPAADERIHHLVHVASELAAAAEREVIVDIAGEHVGDVVIAKPVIETEIVGVLLKGFVRAGLAGCGIAISSVVAHRIGQTFRKSVVSREFEPFREAALHTDLQCVVILDSGSFVEPRLSNLVFERWVSRQVRARDGGPIRQQHFLIREQYVGQMIAVLADICNLNGGGTAELMLEREIPLIRNGRPVVGIGNVDADSRKARSRSRDDIGRRTSGAA